MCIIHYTILSYDFPGTKHTQLAQHDKEIFSGFPNGIGDSELAESMNSIASPREASLPPVGEARSLRERRPVLGTGAIRWEELFPHPSVALEQIKKLNELTL